MALDKGIKHGKEHRKQYRGSKAIDKSCRNHGSCPYCLRNRLFKFRDKHPQTIDNSVIDICESCKSKEDGKNDD